MTLNLLFYKRITNVDFVDVDFSVSVYYAILVIASFSWLSVNVLLTVCDCFRAGERSIMLACPHSPESTYLHCVSHSPSRH